MTATGRPRPLVTAAARQAPVVASGTLLSGGGYLAALVAIGAPIGRLDVLLAVAISAITAFVPLWMARGIIRDGEQVVTPSSDPRDADGRRLTPPDRDLVVALRRNLEALGATEQPRRHSPSGTRVAASVEQARSMTVDDAAAYRAADGPASKQPHERWEPTSDDWYGQSAAAQDERIAREHGPRAERVARATGPDPAQRPRRRHEYRGGPTDGGGR